MPGGNLQILPAPNGRLGDAVIALRRIRSIPMADELSSLPVNTN